MKNIYYLIAIIILIVGGILFIKANNNETASEELTPTPTYNTIQATNDFYGEKGEALTLENDQIKIPTSGFETNKIRYFNTEVNGKTIYFIVVRDEKGIYRAAANGCEVCYKGHKGFSQDGDYIVCNNCGNRFALNTLGITKGGCNPGPISSSVKVVNKELIISSTELSQVSNLF